MLGERREEFGGGASGRDLRGAGRFNLLIAGSVFLLLFVFFTASSKSLPRRNGEKGIGRAPPPIPLVWPYRMEGHQGSI